VLVDYRTLKQFVSLADTLHFGRAAEASHISASALSRNIRQLEEDLGTRLFERDNRSVALTHAGVLMLEYARDALSQWDAIRNVLMEESGELHGEVSIYCSVTASYSFLFDLLSRFRAEHPHIEIKLRTGDPEFSIQRVGNGDEDMAIGARPDPLPTELAFKSMQTTPLVFVVARGGEAAQRFAQNIDAEEFWSQTPMILQEGGLARRRVDDWFRGKSVQPNIYAQVTGNEAIVSMVSLGFGVGVVPRIVLDNSPLADTVDVLSVYPKLEPYDVGLFTRRKKLRSPLINALWSQLK